MLWYFAVTQPIKYARHKNSKRVYLMLGLTWVVSVSISSPIVLGANYTDRRQQTPHLCTFYNSNFLVYSSMGSFYIPCIVMVLLYGKIFNAIRVRARKAAAQKKVKAVSVRSPTTRIQGLKNFQPGPPPTCAASSAPSAELANRCRTCTSKIDEGSNPVDGNNVGGSGGSCVVIDNRNAVGGSTAMMMMMMMTDVTCQGVECQPFSALQTPAAPEQTPCAPTPAGHVTGNDAVVISNLSPCNCQPFVNNADDDDDDDDDDKQHPNKNFLEPAEETRRRESSESFDSACGIAIQPAYADVDQVRSAPAKRNPRTSSDPERPTGRSRSDARPGTTHTFHFRFKRTKAKKALKNEKKLQSAQRRERKATKTLAIVLA